MVCCLQGEKLMVALKRVCWWATYNLPPHLSGFIIQNSEVLALKPFLKLTSFRQAQITSKGVHYRE